MGKRKLAEAAFMAGFNFADGDTACYEGAVKAAFARWYEAREFARVRRKAEEIEKEAQARRAEFDKALTHYMRINNPPQGELADMYVCAHDWRSADNGSQCRKCGMFESNEDAIKRLTGEEKPPCNHDFEDRGGTPVCKLCGAVKLIRRQGTPFSFGTWESGGTGVMFEKRENKDE